uniref:Protein MEF2BNB n=1 Tax=Otus sunia TaxID=257818 RepID=A0A8C8BBH0_9STRI
SEQPELAGGRVTDKFTESMYVLANEPSVALYRLQEHVRRSLPELAQHKVSRASLSRATTQSGTKHFPDLARCSYFTSLRGWEGGRKSAVGVRGAAGPRLSLKQRNEGMLEIYLRKKA